MGGYGSGRWQSGKKTTGQLRAFDVRKIRKLGDIIPDEAESMILETTVRHNGIWQPVSELIRLEWRACNMGGFRVWFLCPKCGRRCAIVYASKTRIACRHCQRLNYACQQESDIDRMIRRVDKIRERLEWEPGFLNESGDRPKGMHNSTFERLRHEHDVLRALVWDAVDQRLDLAPRDFSG